MAFDSSDALGQTVGAQLRAARLAKKYTQYQLAQPDFSVSYISAIERGQIQPSLRALEILSQRLGINSTLLLTQQVQTKHEVHVAGAESATEGENVSPWQLIEASLLLHQHQPAQVIKVLHPLLAHKAEPHRQVALRYLLGRAYLDNALLQESEAILAEAARLAQETSDPLYPRILARQGDVYNAMRQLEQAARCRQASLDALQKRPDAARDELLQARISIDLGHTLSQMGEFEQATVLFQQALAHLQAQSWPQQVDQRLARASQEQGELLRARFLWHKCAQREQQQQLFISRRAIQHTLGRALLHNLGAEAQVSLLALLRQAQSQQDVLLQASANVHLASWSLEHGDLDQTVTFVRAALEMGRACGESEILASALIMQGRLSYAQKGYEQGDRSFQDGLTLLERLRAVEELLANLTIYARLLEERGLPQQALRYWKRAYTIQQDKGSVTR